MPDTKDARLNLVLTPEDLQRLAKLAAANTEGNKSMFVRSVLALVWENPKKFGYKKPPEDDPVVV